MFTNLNGETPLDFSAIEESLITPQMLQQYLEVLAQIPGVADALQQLNSIDASAPLTPVVQDMATALKQANCPCSSSEDLKSKTRWGNFWD